MAGFATRTAPRRWTRAVDVVDDVVVEVGHHLGLRWHRF
jgi:hypothetical protein